MGQLYDAWTKTSGTLKVQKQGTCGLYSFWYASLILSQMGGPRPIVYPRKGEAPVVPGGRIDELTNHNKETEVGTASVIVNDETGRMSMRRYAKLSGITAQGEILSAGEMVQIIRAFGYNCSVHQAADGREAFITASLMAGRPILIAYLTSGGLPIKSGQTDLQRVTPHWSLIIDENESEYVFLDPNSPNSPAEELKSRMLFANSNADAFKLTGGYSKSTVRYESEGKPLPYDERSKTTHVPSDSDPYYRISLTRVQDLTNLFIAVH